MKKVFYVMLAVTTICYCSIFTGCAKQEQQVTIQNVTTEEAVAHQLKQGQKDTIQPIEQSQEEIPLNFDNILLDISFKEPDSLGNVYGELKYTNNTGKTITGYKLVCMRKDNNKKVYYECYDTVLDGESSPVMTNFGPTSRNAEDMQTLEETVTFIEEEGESHIITCDYKLDQYTWT